MKASDKRFQIGVQSDPVEFMSWLLNTLHAKLKSSKKKNRSIIHDCFQVSFSGQVDINSLIDIISSTYQVTLELFL